MYEVKKLEEMDVADPPEAMEERTEEYNEGQPPSEGETEETADANDDGKPAAVGGVSRLTHNNQWFLDNGPFAQWNT